VVFLDTGVEALVAVPLPRPDITEVPSLLLGAAAWNEGNAWKDWSALTMFFQPWLLPRQPPMAILVASTSVSTFGALALEVSSPTVSHHLHIMAVQLRVAA